MTTEIAGTSAISVHPNQVFQSHSGRERRPLNIRVPSHQFSPDRGAFIQHRGNPAGNPLSIQIGGLQTIIGMAEDVPVDSLSLDAVGKAQGRDARGEGGDRRVCPPLLW